LIDQCVLAAVGRRDEHQLRQPAGQGRRDLQALAAGRADADRQQRRDLRGQRQRHHAVLAATRIRTCGRATARSSPTRWTSRAFPDVARSFYTFCQHSITADGYFYHKYNPDGSPASSWHPWVMKGIRSLPIQEDETALVVWALWRHYYRYRDIEFIRPMWVDIVQKAADFMCKYRDPRTGLPLPSYDLWEERWGVHAFTVATVYGGLKAAANFAVCFGDRERAERYKKAAEEIKIGAAKYLYSEKLGRFVRRLVPKDNPVPPGDPNYKEPQAAGRGR
jgi:hypothetical protein